MNLDTYAIMCSVSVMRVHAIVEAERPTTKKLILVVQIHPSNTVFYAPQVTDQMYQSSTVVYVPQVSTSDCTSSSIKHGLL